MEKDLTYSDLTRKIIGAAMKVHSCIGSGFPEIIYQRCLVIELIKLDMICSVGEEREIYYEGQFVGKRRLDVLVEDKILVELKAVSELDKVNYNQVTNYLKVFNIQIGLVLNFGAPSLQFKRFIHSEFS